MKKPKPLSALLIHTKNGAKAILRAFSSYGKAIDWIKKVARENCVREERIAWSEEELTKSDRLFEEFLSTMNIEVTCWAEIKDLPSGMWSLLSIRAMVNGDFTELQDHSQIQIKNRGVFRQDPRPQSDTPCIESSSEEDGSSDDEWRRRTIDTMSKPYGCSFVGVDKDRREFVVVDNYEYKGSGHSIECWGYVNGMPRIRLLPRIIVVNNKCLK